MPDLMVARIVLDLSADGMEFVLMRWLQDFSLRSVIKISRNLMAAFSLPIGLRGMRRT
jgi:hypothetical protein